MKILTNLFILLLFTTLTIAAQQTPIKPDFTGRWVLDEKKSKIADGFWNNELNITHRDPELKITLKGLLKGQNKSAEAVFYTDKRGEKNKPYFFYPEVEEESVTYWKGNSIVRNYKDEIKGETPVKSKTTETYRLSKDQNTLTLTIDRFSLFRSYISPVPIEGRVIQKFVFRRG